jgi:uncharacterized membrane protein YeaQ/YmgE (transglycosylase-associated protein family)
MSVLAWIVLGLLAGYLSSTAVNRHGRGLLMDIVLGVVGAVFGGLLFNAIGATGISGLNLWSLIVSVAGSVVFLIVAHALRRVA